MAGSPLMAAVLCATAILSVASTLGDADLLTFPRQEKDVSFKQYSGFLDVLPGRHIHYVYVESSRNPAEDPVVFWTNGGPGCSGLLGFLAEMGPWRPHREPETGVISLKENPFSWNHHANMVFLEQPVGVGFSYLDGSLSDLDFGDVLAAIDNTRVVRKFFEKFPARKNNDFYLASESYGGHYIPQWAIRVLADDVLNNRFKGVLLGNPYVNLGSIFAGGISALWGMQLIPMPLWGSAVKHGCSDFELASDEDTFPEICFTLYEHLFNLNKHVNPYALNYPICPEEAAEAATKSQKSALYSKAKRLLSQRVADGTVEGGLHSYQYSPKRKAYRDNSNEPGFDFEPCTESWVEDYLNLPEVKEAMHVNRPNMNASFVWKKCSDFVYENWNADDFVENTVPLFNSLVNQGIKVLIISGDTDGICSTHGTQDWVFRVRNTTLKQRWSEWSIQNDDENWQTAGYLTKFTGGLSFSTVRNAGHEVPLYRPAEAYHLFGQFLNGSELFHPDINDFDFSELYYGTVSFHIQFRFIMHSPVVPIDEFFAVGNEALFAFVIRALRHSVDRKDVPLRLIAIEGVSDHGYERDRRGLSSKTTRSINLALRIETDVSFDMQEAVIPSTTKDDFGSSEVVSAVVSALNFQASLDRPALADDAGNADNRQLSTVLERKHQRLVDDNLKLKALSMKQKIFVLLNSALLSGALIDFIDAALIAEDNNPNSKLSTDVKINDLSIVFSPEFSVTQVLVETPIMEWDDNYAKVQFPDMTSAPTAAPALLGLDSETPIFIFTESSWIVIFVCALLSSLAALMVGYYFYRRSMRAVQYYPVFDNAVNDESGGDVEMTGPPADQSY